MMTMLHSVWSGGGSAAGRRRSLLALGALLALVASVLIAASPTHAQGNTAPPIAIAVVGDLSGTTQTLDGSNSFDPDGGNVTFKWEVMTAAYSWLALSDYEAASPTFTVPSAELAARYGQTLEFKLTVTDDDTPSASASTTLSYEVNQRPTADITVTAHVLEEDGDADDIDHYSVDAVIAGPGEEGNADNEWDIMEGALLVLDGSGSSDSNGRVVNWNWSLTYPASAVSGLSEGGPGYQLSTDLDDGGPIETIDNISRGESPLYAYYTLTVTDNDGVSSRGAVVKLVIWDQPASPEVKLTAADGDDNAATNVQQSRFPSNNPKYIVSPGGTVVITAEATDADGDATIANYSWTGGETQDDDPATDVNERNTQRVVKVDKDAEDGTVINVSVAVSDNSGLTTTGSIDLQVVAGNNQPTAEILNSNIIDAGGNRLYLTADGNAGGDTDPATQRKTGKIVLRAVGFDPDQPANTLIYAWNQINAATQMPINPDKYEGIILEMEAANDMVTITVPEIGNDADDAPPQTQPIIVSLAVLDQYGTLGSDAIVINLTPANSPPKADAGPDQIVEPGAFVRLNGAGSADPDKGESITNADHVWSIKSISTTPGATEVLKSVRDQALKDLNAWYEAWTGEDQAGDADADVGQLSSVLSGTPGRYPYFTAPKVADGLSNVQITFTLTVTDDDSATNSDDVTITVTNKFYSGNVSGPNFCTGMSLGGPRTFAYDSDGDGVADVCSLRTTRRGSVAVQNALESLVRIGSTVSRTDAGEDGDAATEDDNRTSPVGYDSLVVGQDGVNDNLDTANVNEVAAAVTGTCDSIPGLDKLGDEAADLASDACATGKVSGPPAPVDPTVADVFFSGVVTGPDYCTNASLGGARTYAYDSDGDDVADTCSLPYTKREAVARQAALEMYKAHPQYNAAVSAACRALGSTSFGDREADLARDECSPQAADPVLGSPLPAPSS